MTRAATIKKDKAENKSIGTSANEQDIPLAEEIPLEKVIDRTLQKNNVTDAVIAQLKEKFGNVSLKDVGDKESFLEVKEARKTVRSVGIVVERLCKKGREDAIAIQRKWLSKEREILEKIAEVQDPLDADIKRFEDEQERLELEKKKKQEERYINRQSLLLKMGAQYQDGHFVLNHISYETELLRQADEDMWDDTILPKYQKVYAEMEVAKVAEENKRKEEMEEQRRKQEEFEQQQLAFKKQQEEFAAQQKLLQEQKDAHEREVRLAQEKKDAEERQQKQMLVDARLKRLNTLNITWDYRANQYVFIDDRFDYSEALVENKVVIPVDLSTLSDAEYDTLMETIFPMYDAQKKIVEEKRLADIEAQKQAAIQQAFQDEEIRNQQEQQRREEELAQASDKSKWAHYTAQLNAIAAPEFKSNIYKKKIAIAKEKLEEISDL